MSTRDCCWWCCNTYCREVASIARESSTHFSAERERPRRAPRPVSKLGEELYDNWADPYQMQNLVDSGEHGEVLQHLRTRMSELLQVAHDDFRRGTGYVGWCDQLRNLIATGLGPVTYRSL
jgi:hypothetical protein